MKLQDILKKIQDTYSFNQIKINKVNQFDSKTSGSINLEGINLVIYSADSNTLVFSAQPQTNTSSTFTGGTVTGLTVDGNITITGNTYTESLSATTINVISLSATTYQNLPFDDLQITLLSQLFS